MTFNRSYASKRSIAPCICTYVTWLSGAKDEEMTTMLYILGSTRLWSNASRARGKRIRNKKVKKDVDELAWNEHFCFAWRIATVEFTTYIG
jgi:hypothetical protein